MKKLFAESTNSNFYPLFLAILFCAGIAWPTNYYIDFASGTDAANGTGTSTSWKHCPGDANATSNPSSATINPGDTLFFKGGVIYTGQLVGNWSGSSGFVICYDGNTSGTWGAGRAIIDGNGSYNGT